ncbi:MAG: hypothetical protein ACP5M7_10075 [Thermoproteota archaeon]
MSEIQVIGQNSYLQKSMKMGLGEKVVWRGKDGRGKEITIKINYRGKWRIDQTWGKAIMVIMIKDPKTGETVDYCPSYEDICKGILGGILQAELENDLYVFKQGDSGEEKRRPAQIFKKIEDIRKRLTEWWIKALVAHSATIENL